MKESPVDVLRTILSRYFKDEWYAVGITNLRNAIKEDPFYRDSWVDIIKLILLRQMPEGNALDMIFENANQCLRKNTEDEAYIWLLLMVINVSRSEDEVILDDQKFITRNPDIAN